MYPDLRLRTAVDGRSHPSERASPRRGSHRGTKLGWFRGWGTQWRVELEVGTAMPAEVTYSLIRAPSTPVWPGFGCVSTLRLGLASVSCTCEREDPPACSDETPPPAIGRRRERVQTLCCSCCCGGESRGSAEAPEEGGDQPIRGTI